MNFELYLTLATLISFVFWIIHKFVFSNRLIEFIQSLFGVLLLVLLIRTFLFEPFRIPSSSMRPTLVIGDFVLVNKYVYGLKLPVTRTKIFEVGKPERGDIVVFKFPRDIRIDYIKRIVGIPGDEIKIVGKELYINNELVKTKVLGTKQWANNECYGFESTLLEEQLPGKTHRILNMPERPVLREGTQVIPEGNYFVMGDNRDNSGDSRFWGLLPEELIIGKAQAIWLNIDWGSECSKGVQLNRIGGIESNH